MAVDNVSAAVAMASKNNYAALLINPTLLPANGVQEISSLRAVPGHEQLVVLAITDDDSFSYGDLKMNGVINIPLDQERLYTTLEKCLTASSGSTKENLL